MNIDLFDRWYASPLAKKLKSPYVHILFGARQTGKSTLLRSLLPESATIIDLADPQERASFSARPGEFSAMCRALPRSVKPKFVFVDEVQTVPSVLDAVQSLYDSEKARWRFVLCGSSARKLRRTGANLLPGRSFLHRLYPLVLCEQPLAIDLEPDHPAIVPMRWPQEAHVHPFPAWSLEDRLAYGCLPGIVAARQADRAEILKAFAALHLEEEIRRETLIRNWGDFIRFLHYAALGSGQMLNFASISRETGISQPTIKNYYQLLEDMFVGFRVPAFTRSVRKGLIATPRFFLFDLGVRNAAAGLEPSRITVAANPGPLFEQWVGIELWKRLQYLGAGTLSYFRTKSGSEIDFIVQRGNALIPIEAKWTESPSARDTRHILAFMEEHPRLARIGYIVCRCPRPLQLHEKVIALPWELL
jgi:predicted AAA+ superfamily ATPase